MGRGVGIAGYLAIGFHEADQAPAGRIDRFQSLANLSLHFVFHSQQRIAERRDRSDRIHDLVRQHADQANPRLGLPLVELVVDVVDRQNAQPLPPDRDFRRVDRQIDRTALVRVGSLFSLPSPDREEKFPQRAIYRGQLIDMGKPGKSDQPPGFVVDLVHVSGLVENNHARMNAIENQFVVPFLVDNFVLSLDQQILDAVQRQIQQVVADRSVVLGELERIVSVFYRVEHESHLADILEMQPEQGRKQKYKRRNGHEQQHPLAIDDRQRRADYRGSQQKQQSGQPVCRSLEHNKCYNPYFLILL